MIVVNPNGTVDPIHIGPIEVQLRRSTAPIMAESTWLALAYAPGSSNVVTHGWGSMPDDAVNAIRERLVELRDALVLACMDVASLPGCGGAEMMPLEADEEAA